MRLVNCLRGADAMTMMMMITAEDSERRKAEKSCSCACGRDRQGRRNDRWLLAAVLPTVVVVVATALLA